jgi:hypothetical protein
MNKLTKLGFKIAQVFQGNTTMINHTTGMVIESERDEATGMYNWYLFDSSDTLVFQGTNTADIENYLGGVI